MEHHLIRKWDIVAWTSDQEFRSGCSLYITRVLEAVAGSQQEETYASSNETSLVVRSFVLSYARRLRGRPTR